MKVTVQCTSKNERLEGNATIADVTLSPTANMMNNPMYATGSAMGTPNAPQQPVSNPDGTPQQAEVPQFTLNGALSFTVRDQEQAQTFRVGQSYEINVDVTQNAAPPAKNSK